MIDTPSTTAYRLGWTYPVAILRSLFSVGLLLVLALTVFVPWAVPYFPAVLFGAVAGWLVIRNDRINLFVVLGSFVAVASFDEGIDPLEILYALFYLGYLSVWYFRRILLSDEPLVRSGADVILLAFFGLVTVYVFVGLIFGAQLRAVVAEYQSMTLLLFYFPVKEAVERQKNGLKWLVFTLAWLGLFVVFRNSWELATKLVDVTQAWQVTIKGRVVTNEMLMLVPGFLLLAQSLVEKRFKQRLFSFALFLTLFFGLVITQGRGYWLGFAFGLGIMFLIVDGRMRGALLIWGFVGVLGVIAAIFLFFGQHALLLATGLVNRIISIGTASATDISLIGRFIEWASVLTEISRNPIMGYGPGVEISYYDITRSVTMVRPWIHNGYLAVLFKYGILGLGLILAFTLVPLKHAILAARSQIGTPLVRACAFGIAASLSAVLISTIPSNAWHNSDTLLMVAVMAGMAEGCYSRTRA